MRIRVILRRAVLLAAAAFTAFPAAGRADVTVERFQRSGGLMGLGASESTAVEKLAGLKKRETRWIKPTGNLGRVIGTIAGRIVTDEITVLPEGTVRKLDHGKKSYEETRIAAPKANGAPGTAKGDRREKPKVRMIRNEIEVRETGERKTVNGFDCRRHIASWVIETESAATGERSRATMINDLWFAPDTKETRALRKEERAFADAWEKKAGPGALDREAEEMGLSAVADLFGSREAVLEKYRELRRRISGIEGFPVVSGVRWESATTRQARPAAEAREKAREEAANGGIGGILSGAAKETIEEKQQGNGKGAQAGSTVLFALHTEIRRIDLSRIPRSEFEVPRGYGRAE